MYCISSLKKQSSTCDYKIKVNKKQVKKKWAKTTNLNKPKTETSTGTHAGPRARAHAGPRARAHAGAHTHRQHAQENEDGKNVQWAAVGRSFAPFQCPKSCCWNVFWQFHWKHNVKTWTTRSTVSHYFLWLRFLAFSKPKQVKMSMRGILSISIWCGTVEALWRHCHQSVGTVMSYRTRLARCWKSNGQVKKL